MHHFRQELREQKGNRKKITRRIRGLQKLMVWHYILLFFSGFQAGTTLFIVINVPGVPYREWLFALAVASVLVACYLFYSGLAK